MEELDQDGAIREAAEKVGGDTRAAFLKKAGIGAGAVLGGGALMGALPSIASAGVAASDVAILNFALTLEYLEATFYAQAKANKVGGSNADLSAFINIVAGHESAHVAFLRGALGKAAVGKPKFDFKDTVTNQAKFQATAQVLEDTGVMAYLGQAGNIKSKKILAAAGSVLSVEARHAAWIRDINSQSHNPGVNPSPAPAAFQGSRTKGQILAAVKATGFIVG
ncbi:MAG: ferritin-like domain-containing protein [Gaiellaceae bacterium]